MTKIRTFDTGATRDSESGKLDYEGFLSPIVIQEYARYMDKHRLQPDGSLRGSDNWQRHFGDKHYEVCMKSLLRHVMDMWLSHRGEASGEGIEDAMMGVMFNVMAYADKHFKDKRSPQVDKTTQGGKCYGVPYSRLKVPDEYKDQHVVPNAPLHPL